MTSPELRVRGRMLDVDYEIATSEPELDQFLAAAFRDSSTTEVRDPVRLRLRRGPVGEYLISVDDRVVRRTNRGVSALALIIWLVNRAVVDRSSHTSILHAACLVRGGAAVLVVGRSGAGKTTAAVALARSGFAYATDDVVAVTSDGLVVGSMKPLGLRTSAIDALDVERHGLVLVPRSFRDAELEQFPIAASAIELPVSRLPARPQVVVFPRADLPPDRVIELRPAVTVARLCEFAFTLGSGGEGFDHLVHVGRTAVGVEWGRGDLARLGDMIRDVLSA